MHHVTRLEEQGGAMARDGDEVARQLLIGPDQGSVHMGMTHATLAPGAAAGFRHHSFEQSFFVLAGDLVVALTGEDVALSEGDTIRLPVGTPYALRNDGPTLARWLEMAAPQPRHDPNLPPDTFPIPPGDPLPEPDTEGDDVVVLRAGDPKTGDRASQSVGDAVDRIDHLKLEMLVEHPFGLHSMFIADAGPGAYLGPHDHPHEEGYLMLSGHCEWVFDGTSYLLGPGDVAWSGVGSIHVMHNVTEEPCRWLETQAPMPAARHAIRYF